MSLAPSSSEFPYHLPWLQFCSLSLGSYSSVGVSVQVDALLTLFGSDHPYQAFNSPPSHPTWTLLILLILQCPTMALLHIDTHITLLGFWNPNWATHRYGCLPHSIGLIPHGSPSHIDTVFSLSLDTPYKAVLPGGWLPCLTLPNGFRTELFRKLKGKVYQLSPLESRCWN